MQVSQNWRLNAQRYGLVGERCPSCGGAIFPPRDVCPDCAAEAKVPYQLSGRGEIYSYTVIQDAPAGFEEQAPYYLAIIKLEEGPMLTAQLTDLDGAPEIGMPVEMVTRKLRTEGKEGMIVYGYKFRKVIAQ
jgi:uncharacterized OB-fold protein